MPDNGKLRAGEHLADWQNKPGEITVVVSVVSGKLHTPIDLRAPRTGSMAERCAMYGGPTQWARKDTK